MNKETEKRSLPVAKYKGVVNLNGFKINCVVLDNGQRIFIDRSLANAFGIRGGGAFYERKKLKKGESAVLPEYLSDKYLKPFISKELEDKFSSAVSYISTTGIEEKGIDVTVLPDICNFY